LVEWQAVFHVVGQVANKPYIVQRAPVDVEAPLTSHGGDQLGCRTANGKHT